MNEFDNFKQISYQLIAECIEKNPANVATNMVIEIVEKLLTAKDMQVQRLATEKATTILSDLADKAFE